MAEMQCRQPASGSTRRLLSSILPVVVVLASCTQLVGCKAEKEMRQMQALKDSTQCPGHTHAPACRKSPEVHFIRPRFEGGGLGHPDLIAFGGKGRVYVPKKWAQKDEDALPTGGVEDEDDIEAEEDRQEELLDEHGLKAKAAILKDTWSFDLTQNAWHDIRLEPRQADHPIQRWKPGSTSFDDDSRMALFGGCATTAISGVMQDLWVFELIGSDPTDVQGKWYEVKTSNPPVARRGHITVANNTHLFVGGGKGVVDGVTTIFRDMWTLPLKSIRPGSTSTKAGVWKELAQLPFSPRWGSTSDLLTDHTGKQFMAIFGGRILNKGFVEHVASGEAYTYFNELWLLDCVENSWKMIDNTKGAQPHVRDHHAAAALGAVLYVFGGRTSEVRAASSVLNDLWSFNLNDGTWTLVSPGVQGLLPRFMPGLGAFGPGESESYPAGAVVLFAGEVLPGSTKRTSMNGVWAYDLSTSTWNNAFTSDCSARCTALSPVDLTAQSVGFRSLLQQQPVAALVLAASLFAVSSILVFKVQAWWRPRSRARRCRAIEVASESDAYAGYQLMM